MQAIFAHEIPVQSIYALNKRRDSENGEADTILTDDRDRVRVSGRVIRVIIRRNSVCRNRVCQNSVVNHRK